MSVATVVFARQLVKRAAVEDAMAVLEVEHLERAERREARRPKPNHRPLSCPACHRFVRSTSAPCGCGWDPAGGWGS